MNEVLTLVIEMSLGFMLGWQAKGLKATRDELLRQFAISELDLLKLPCVSTDQINGRGVQEWCMTHQKLASHCVKT